MKRFLCVLCIVLVVLGGMLLAAGWFIRHQLNQPEMLVRASDYASRLTGRTCVVGEIRISWIPLGMVFARIQAGDAAGTEAFSADAIAVDVDIFRRGIRAVRVIQPHLRLWLESGQEATPAEVLRQQVVVRQAAEKPASPDAKMPARDSLHVARAALVNGRLEVVYGPAAGSRVLLRAEGVDLQLKDLQVTGGGAVTCAEGVLTVVEGELAGAPFRALEIQGGLAADALALEHVRLQMMDGEVEGVGRIVWQEPELHVTVASLSGTNVEPFPALQAWGVPEVEGYAGRVYVQASGEGSGWDWRTWQGRVKMTAPVLVYTGLGGSPADKLVATLGETPLPELFSSVRRAVEDARRAMVTVKRTQINDVFLEGHVAEEMVHLDRVQAVCEGMGMTLSGWVQPEAGGMALSATLLAFGLEIPMRLEGTLERPVVGVEMHGDLLGGLIKPKHVEKVNKFLGSLLQE